METPELPHAEAPALPAGLLPWLERWALAPDGAVIRTPTSLLLPVRWRGQAAMLIVAAIEEEQRGGQVLACWAGDGAARVFEIEHGALVMERASGPRSLAALAQGGADDAASRLLCATAAGLHRQRRPCPAAFPLAAWFASLAPVAAREGGILRAASAAATRLLETPQEPAVLHGDLHHGNVLDFGARGWLAIDPKGLYGERGYDFANIFCNPDAAVALTPGRLARQVDVVAEAAGLERTRLLQWVLAYAGLSAAWSLEDGDDPALALAVAQLAAAELAK